MYLTDRQKEIYQYIKTYIQKNSIAPSYEEIKKNFGFKSLSTVFEHLQNLEKKGFIQKGSYNQKRAIQLINFGKRTITIPLVGTVAAGNPLETYETIEYIDVPEEMLGKGENVALKVRGNSMIDSGIFDRDIVIVKRQATAENGQIVVAIIDREVTIKKIYFQKNVIELRASNPEVKPIFVTAEKEFQIYGILVGLYRKF